MKHILRNGIVVITLVSCTVKTPCPLRINAGADDPECAENGFVLTKSDSTVLDHVLTEANCGDLINLRYFAAWNKDGYITNIEFRGCSSENISTEIGKLKYLTDLKLSGIGLKQLPKEISNIPKLEILNIDSNSISDIPIEILNLRTLRILKLENNSLCNLDSTKISKIELITKTAFNISNQRCQ